MLPTLQSRETGRAEIATILGFMGAALLFVYLATVVSVVLPPALLLPEWQLRMAGSLRGGASFPLEGCALILIAYRINPNASSLAKSVAWLRTLAVLPAIGFLLLPPLQLAAGYGQLNQVRNKEEQVIRILSDATSAIRAARTSADFTAAVAQLPGAPPLRSAPVQDFQADRRQLLSQLEPQILQLRSQVAASRSNQLGQTLILGLRDALVSLFYAVPFAALARLPGGRYSLLSELIHWGETLFATQPIKIWQRASDAVSDLFSSGKRSGRR
jgi:hypothetical protein